MKVIKPTKLGILTRCFEHRRRFHFGVSILAFVPLRSAEVEASDAGVSLLPEISLWKFVTERMGAQVALDAGVPKCRGEYLVHGQAFAPGGVAAPMVPVRARVGGLEKSLAVSGDRYWESDFSASDPRPFTSMMLDWSRAYGGPKYAKNPLGRGHGETLLHGERLRLLPNVERPGAGLGSADEQAEPAGFGAIDLSWPQRQALVGTYDQAWLDRDFPGLARDVDWGFFNIAPRDQQREGFWEGGEAYAFDNLHPSRARLEGRLPDYVARAFVTRVPPRTPLPKGEARAEKVEALAAKLEEIALRLQTLWFFPDAERAVMIFQGSLPIATDDGTDVRHLVIAAERKGDAHQRPQAHYARVLADRLDLEHGALAGMRDHELLPAGAGKLLDDPIFDEERALHESQDLLGKNLHRRAVREHAAKIAELRAQGIDPSLFPDPPAPPEPTPELDEIPALIEKVMAEAEETRAREEARIEQDKERMYANAEAEGVDVEALREGNERGQVGPPTYTAEAQREMLRGAIADCQLAGASAEVFEQMLADPELQASWDQAELDMREGYRMSAHSQSPAPRLEPERRDAARAAVREALLVGEDFSTLNLSGADLSGMDLRGAQLRGALFESANFDGADLSGADLSKAVLAHGSLVGTKLDGARLDGTNLGKARLEGASLRGAQLVETILHGADLTGASLAGARLEGVLLIEVVLKDVDLSEAEAHELKLIELEVSGLRARGARLLRAVFIKLDLAATDFSGAQLERCSFLECSAVKAEFSGANLQHASFVGACELDAARFVEAKLASCNLRGSSMKGAELSKAQLDGADLSAARLEGARFYRAVARGARFDKAELGEAVMMSANLMGASFIGAGICGVDLRGANLYGADMARVRTDERVQLQDALLTKVRVNPSYDPRSEQVGEEQRRDQPS
ncbi:DUF2169 domain-containing protein [Pseudenhygromyxa sp. WMMC2535]|uniref:DUF2169 family type VI secretion system accessory protein n=1 Tax=Pseudenhygromyxa sp. WMMC2535 TaxID=2712867 RepID=UPI001552B33E|nr:DUF2169 domain-containing protein [Pseudenhygromyxa sp. WMMC2535]NVB40144.1 DUF2169 domain-containing protein [Pseudenhygromyxa sp. WMMC2535]